MTETRLKTVLLSLAIPYDPFKLFIIGQQVSELGTEPIYFTRDIINFISTFRTENYPLQKQSK
jgi:hypothetical protein